VTGEHALDVYADLAVEVGDAKVSVRGYGDLVVVRAPTLAAARGLAGGGTQSVLERLCAAEVTVDLRVGNRSVARAGPGHEPGVLSRALGVAPARLSPGGVLLSLFT
jgi:hypothetical protein